MSAYIWECEPDQYHACVPGDVPYLSSSIAHTLISRSPLHAWAQHPKLGNVMETPTKEMDLGTLVHAMLLGKGPDISVLSFDNYRKADAQKQRDEAREAGRVPVLAAEYDQLTEIVHHLHKRIEDEGVTLDGEPEVAIVFEEQTESGAAVKCRRMIDRLNLETGTVIELKTIASADEHACNGAAYRFGWDLSYAATLSAVGQIAPALAGRIVHKYVILEKVREKPYFKPPYVVAVRECDGMFEEHGILRWQRAVKLWEECLRLNEWPGYDDAPLSVPTWALAQEQAEDL